MKPQLLIAAASSGAGKTTFTMGLLRAWQRKGWQVQPFKCGPDYIDTQFHSIAAGRTSVNLDIWMSSEQHVRDLYARYSVETDACVVEGVMGLFDGFQKDQGSAAHVAQVLDIPVILLVSAKSAAYSVAPLIYGFKHFNPKVRIAGVVFNQVASTSHFSYLQDACQDAGLPCLGYLEKCPQMEVPSRHLGLTLENRQVMNEWIDRAADLVEAHVDLDLLADICGMDETGDKFSSPKTVVEETLGLSSAPLRIAVAKDEAFSFMYRANLDVLEQMGQVSYFSPLRDEQLPAGIDFLYLPGGYPELFAEPLSANHTMLQSIRQYAENDGKVLAECGGMMYLSQQLISQDGTTHYPMVGILPYSCTMQGAKLHLGYRTMTLNGQTWWGHEFHYSDIVDTLGLISVTQQCGAKGNAVSVGLYRIKNVLAGYTHWYWGENKSLLSLFDL